MILSVLDIESTQKNNKDQVEFYGHDSEGGTYGPIRVYMGKLYITNPMWYSEAKPLVQRLQTQFGKENCTTQKYGTAGKFVIWVRTFDPENDELIWQEHERLLRHTPTMQYVKHRMNYPEHQLKIRKDLAEVLQEQQELHQNLGHLHSEYILPLLAAGISQEDCMRWLWMEDKSREKLGSRIKTNAEKRIASYANAYDENFFKETAPVLSEISLQADGIEEKLKEINPQNWLQRCWQKEPTHHDSQNPFRSIIYLESTDGIYGGIARLFG